MDEKNFDVVLFGATGFTGGLTAEYLAGHGGAGLRWAVAGRNRAKLESLVDRLETAPGPRPAPAPQILEASLDDADALRAMASQTRVVATTVGPYARYGEPVVRACVEGGADYADITGEPEFVNHVRAVYGPQAEEKSLRLVSCCGFDSIPHDVGAWFTVRRLAGEGPVRLEGIVSAKGTVSGGTWHSAVEAMGRFGRAKTRPPSSRSAGGSADRKVRPLKPKVRYEPRVKGWICPMPTIDPVIVLRSARALDLYGSEFRYGHYVRVGSLPRLVSGAALVGGVFTLAQLPPTRKLLLSYRGSGDGPDAETRARSSFRVTFLGRRGSKQVITEARGGDPGYGETSKMLAESALCLAFDRDRLPERFGHLTPVAAMEEALYDRLCAAGLEFEVMAE